MKLNIIYGRSGSGKSKFLYEKIGTITKNKVFVIVPEQCNLSVEKKLFDEVTASLKEAPLTDGVRTMILYRLSGDGMPGRTWQQLAHEQNIEQIDVQLQFIEGLHIWLNTIIATSDYLLLLNKLAEGIRVEVVLTGSANQTAQLFNKGYSIEQMSFMELKNKYGN